MSVIDTSARRDLALSYRREIEDYVAQGDGVRALALLFDFVGEFAPNFEERVLDASAGLQQHLNGHPSAASVEPLRRAIAPLLATIIAFVLPQDSAASTATEVSADVDLVSLKKRLTEGGARDVLVAAVHASRTMGAGRSTFSLGPISLEAARGEVIGLVGHNGSGKTTLLRLLAADLAPSAGAVLFPGLGAQGPRQDWPKVRARIAFVEPQPPRVRERLEPALIWTAVAHGMDYGQAEEGARVALHRFGLAAHAGKRATELSTGLRLRFEIARILMTNPDLIILDEPLANLDVVAQQALLFDLQMLAASVQQPRSILISSQHINEIEAIADRVIVLSQGQSLFVGRKDEIAAKLGVNVFEVVSENRRALVQAARTLGALEVIELGVSVVLVVPQAVSREALLAQLGAASVDVTGFYDLSRSAKALLYIDRLVSDGRIAATVRSA